MGGVTVVSVEVFRQTFLLIRKGTKADELKACLKQSYLLREVTKLHLTANMKAPLFGDQTAGLFSCQLLNIGNVCPPNAATQVTL